MSTLIVPKGEHGKLRLFALSMTRDAAIALRDTPALQHKALGTDALDPAHVEVFPLADLGDLGLAGYLRDGVDIDPRDIARDQAKLAALDGWVMLVYSNAFGSAETQLTLAPELTLIGTYASARADQTPLPLEAETAQPYSGVTAPVEHQKPTRTRGGFLVVAVLLILAALVLLWAFI